MDGPQDPGHDFEVCEASPSGSYFWKERFGETTARTDSMMTEEEQKYLQEQLPVLKNKWYDTTNRIAILLKQRADLNKQMRGIRVRLKRAKEEEVSDW